MSPHSRIDFDRWSDESARRAPRPRRWLPAALDVLILILIVLLAGFFLFPAHAHAGRACEARCITPQTAVPGTQPAGPAARAR